MAKQIVYEELKAYIDEGKKKEELAEIYDLPMSQVTKLLQQAGLKIRKFHAPKFELIGAPIQEVANTRPADLDVQEEAMGGMSVSQASNIADESVVQPEEEFPWEDVPQTPSEPSTPGTW